METEGLRYAFGLGCGLVYITKNNAVLIIIPIAAYVFIRRVRKGDAVFALFKMGIISAVSALLMALPTFIRNHRFCGDPLASDYFGRIGIGTLSPSYVAVNIVKNLASVSAWGERMASLLAEGVEGFAACLNVPLNAPEIAFNGNEYDIVYSYSMDRAGAPIVMLLFGMRLCMEFAGYVKTEQMRKSCICCY